MIGEEASLGARLEAANKDFRTHILIGEETFRQVEGRIAARELDVIRFRGIERPVRVFEVLGVEPLDPARAHRRETFEAALTAFRERNWRLARDLFAEILDGAPDDHPAAIYLARCDAELDRAAEPATEALP